VKRVLFVDRERKPADDLSEVLRRHRRQWEVVVAVTGEAATAELAKAAFDVIVVSTALPGTSGVALLEKVKEQHPATIRIALTSPAERGATNGALAVAHRCLSKPCDADALRTAIERTYELHGFLDDPAIRAVVGKMSRLPSVPRTYREIIRLTSERDASIAEIGRVVQQDPAMTAKILQLVNSAYFGLAQPMTSINQAVTYLGVELLKGLVLTADVFASAESAGMGGLSLVRLQRYALQAARLARMFLDDPKQGEEAFTASLVRDVGTIVLASGLPEPYREIAREVRRVRRPVQEVELERLGVTHAEIGAYLLGMWGLPWTIVEAVAYHHQPRAKRDGRHDVLAAVHVADALLEAAWATENDSPPTEIDVAFIEEAGFASELPHWRALAARRLLNE
jgi:HD-like signal output (HDOD) protein